MKALKKSHVLYHAAVLAFAALMIYPLAWMVMSSLKESSTIFHTANELIPANPTLENYVQGWKGFSHTTFATFFLNTAWVALIGTFGTLVSSPLVAYALSRLNFRLRRALFGIVLVTMMLPEQVLMIPQYLWFNSLGWVNTYYPMTVPAFFATHGFYIYLLMNFMSSIPRELDAAAKIDGCSFYSIYARVILPLSAPAMATVGIFSFIGRWNDYMAPLLYLKRTNKYTVSLALKLFMDNTSSSDYGALFAMSALSLAPIFIIFVTMQRHLTEGVSTTGLKG
jgi:multiple sugar transport system permease protein